jgi:hypothetical protein
LPAFTEGLVNQLAADLQRINLLGVKKVVAATLPLLGCLPIHIIPPNTYQNCDEEYNKNAKIHNQLLQKALEKLNTDDGNKSTFVILDLYNAMVSAIDQFRQNAGNLCSCFFFNQNCFFFNATQVNVYITFLLSTCHSKHCVQEPTAAMLLEDC